MTHSFTLRCVLFDLDGTLVDTAPDLLNCLNQALCQHGLKKVNHEQIRPFISYGAMAMIEQSTPPTISVTLKKAVLDSMLSRYQNNIAEYSQFFAGISDTLDSIEKQGLKWGIVTNKHERFTQPLTAALQLTHRAACIISGDTTTNSKPHPEPLLAGCQQAKVKAEHCVYIGDAQHDIEAGKNANMKTLAALYGYLKPNDQPAEWGADGLIESPAHLTSWITSTCH